MNNIKEKTGKNNSFIIILEDYYGSGWINALLKIVEEKINPDILEKKEIEDSWDFSEYEINFEKDKIKIKIEIDDLGPIGLILKEDITENNKKKLRKWAVIIAEELEK